MLVRGGRGGGDAQFAETDGELVGEGVDVAVDVVEGECVAVDVVEGVPDDDIDDEGVIEGVGVCDGVSEGDEVILGVGVSIINDVLALGLAEGVGVGVAENE